MIDVLYFAWVRERIGLPREKVETGATTVSALVEELKAREARYEAFLRAGCEMFGLPVGILAETPEAQDGSRLYRLDTVISPDPEMQPGVTFFNGFRDLVASGFWSSKIGIEDIGYMGNQPYNWEGCSHEALEHIGMGDKANSSA